MEDAVKIALSSMVSTARANLSVGPPYDLAILRGDGGVTLQEFRVTEDSLVAGAVARGLERHLMRAVAELLPITAATSKQSFHRRETPVRTERRGLAAAS